MSLDILERIDDRLTRLERNVDLVVAELRRLNVVRAADCQRCALQLSEAPTEPPEPGE
jgi:hypothetical protein